MTFCVLLCILVNQGNINNKSSDGENTNSSAGDKENLSISTDSTRSSAGVISTPTAEGGDKTFRLSGSPGKVKRNRSASVETCDTVVDEGLLVSDLLKRNVNGKCWICGKSSSLEPEYQHMKRHWVSSFIYRGKRILPCYKHNSRTAKRNDPYLHCPKCLKSFPYKSRLLDHKCVQKEGWKCIICGQIMQISNRGRHVKNQHGKDLWEELKFRT